MKKDASEITALSLSALFTGQESDVRFPSAVLLRSKRKTLSMELNREGILLVRAPCRLSTEDIERFLLAHRRWILLHTARQRAHFEKYPPPSEKELASLMALAKSTLPERVRIWSGRMGLVPAEISIGKAQSRFGSCTGDDRLRFSCLLMRYPKEAVDYVIVHELAHIRHKNHSSAFYRLVAAHLPDYKAREALLRE